jgi:hypothetical protein
MEKLGVPGFSPFCDRYAPGPGPVSTDRVFGRTPEPNENPFRVAPRLSLRYYGLYPPGPGAHSTPDTFVKSLLFAVPTRYAGDHLATMLLVPL